MRRREFALICTAGFTTVVSGCGSQPQQVNFQRVKEVGYRIWVANDTDTEIVCSVVVVNTANATEVSHELRLDAGEKLSINNVFPSRSANYRVEVSAQDDTLEKVIDVVNLGNSDLVFEITNQEIRYDTEEPPAIDFGISNRTSSEKSFEVIVTEGTSGATYRDVITVPGGEFYMFRNVFEIGKEYTISASVSGETVGEHILNSRTNGISIVLDDDGLSADYGQT